MKVLCNSLNCDVDIYTSSHFKEILFLNVKACGCDTVTDEVVHCVSQITITDLKHIYARNTSNIPKVSIAHKILFLFICLEYCKPVRAVTGWCLHIQYSEVYHCEIQYSTGGKIINQVIITHEKYNSRFGSKEA